MEYPQTPEFGCDMEDFDVEKYWKKQAEIYNAQHVKEMKEELAKLNKIADKQSYEYLINKYFKLIVENAGLENGKMYYTKIPNSNNYIAMDIFKNGTFYLRGYKYDDIPYVKIGETKISRFKIMSKPFKLENHTELFYLMSIYYEIKNDNSFAKKLKESTCKPYSKFYLNILLDGTRIESIEIFEDGTIKEYPSITVRYLSDLMSDENKKIPFILELKGWSEEQNLTYYVKEDRSLYSENKSFKDFYLLSEHEANNFFVLFYDFDLSNYSRYLRKTEKLEPRSLFLVKMLECLGITFKIEENVNLDKLIIE